MVSERLFTFNYEELVKESVVIQKLDCSMKVCNLKLKVCFGAEKENTKYNSVPMITIDLRCS